MLQGSFGGVLGLSCCRIKLSVPRSYSRHHRIKVGLVRRCCLQTAWEIGWLAVVEAQSEQDLGKRTWASRGVTKLCEHGSLSKRLWFVEVLHFHGTF
jgi:hypothetical protein